MTTKDWRRHILILALYGVLTLLMTLPLITHLTTHVVGSGGDVWQGLWRFEAKAELWRVQSSKFNVQSFLYEEFFGGGGARLVNLSVWPWMGLHLLLGQPLAYNIIWLLSFVLSGYAMYLLVSYLVSRIKYQGSADTKYQTRNTQYQILREAPAFLAGLVYMFLPYHVAHAQGHFGAMQLQWLPFLVLTFLSVVRQPNVWNVLLLAGLFAIQAITEHHYALWFVLLAVMWLLGHRLAVRRFWQQPAAGPLSVLLVALLVMFVILPSLPTIRLAGASSELALGQQQTIRFSADLFSFVVPSPWHPLWGSLTAALFSRHFTGNTAEATQFLGLLPLLLIMFFYRRIPRPQKRFWLVVAGVFLIISLGPRLHLFGRVLPLSLPYALVQSWPVFSAVRAVARAGVMVGLSVSVLLGYVLAAELRRRQSALVVAGVVLLEFLFVPVPLQSTAVSSVYWAVRSLPRSTIIEIPAATNYVAASQALYASSQHGKRVLGNIALERAEAPDEAIRSAPAIRQLLYLRTTDLRQARREFFDQSLEESLPDALRWFDVGGILVHTDSLSALQVAAVRHFLEDRVHLLPKQFDDDLLYSIESGQLPATDGVFLMRDANWQHVGFDPDRASVFAEVTRQAAVTIVNTTDQPKKVELSFDTPPESGGDLAVVVDGRASVEYTQPSGRRVVQFPAAPGETLIQFINRLPDKAIIQNPRMEIRNSNSEIRNNTQ